MGGCSSDSLRHHRKHSATGYCYTCLAIGGGNSVGSLSFQVRSQASLGMRFAWKSKDKSAKTSCPRLGLESLTCFHASFFPFCPLFWPPLFLPFSGHLFALFSPLKSALFCRAKGTIQSLEIGSFRMDLSRKFGKEIPSRNLREKRSDQERKISPKRKFWGRYPCGHPAKNFGQALQILENKHFGTDILRGRP